MNEIKLSDLYEALLLGREIEFKLNENDYFLQPYYDDPHINDLNYPLKYVIYDCADKKNVSKVFIGTIDNVLKYNFLSKFSLINNFEKFTIEYIL